MSELYIKKHLIKSYKPIICVPITGTTKDEIFSQAANLIAARIDMIEWRIDYFEHFRNIDELVEILDMLKNICDETVLVATIRTKAEGGLAEIEEDEIKPLLEAIAREKAADIIDIEYAGYRNPSELIAKLRKLGAVVLASRHEMKCTPDCAVMIKLLNDMTADGADIVKLATIPKSSSDVLNLLQVTNAFASVDSNPPVISMAMGNKGVFSRISGEAFGSCVTFGAIGKGSAPGQVQCDELRNILQFVHEAML